MTISMDEITTALREICDRQAKKICDGQANKGDVAEWLNLSRVIGGIEEIGNEAVEASIRRAALRSHYRPGLNNQH